MQMQRDFVVNKSYLVIFFRTGERALTTAWPESVQSIQEVGHLPQRSLKWERQTDLDFLLFIQPF